jgi:peptidoglycan/LPS O-acetylase OafA/YrhL
MHRSRELDGIRGVAVLLVLVWHYVACQLLGAPAGSRLAGFRDALGLTWSGVDLFFVLSGFLITGILLDHRGASNFFRVFYIRRACRILPLYYLLLALYVLLTLLPLAAERAGWLVNRPMPLWTYALFIQNIFMGAAGDFGAAALGVTWSLAVEEQFYLVIPLLIFLFRPKTAGIILLAALIAAPVLRITCPGFHAFVNTLWRADSLLSGACLALLVRKPVFLRWVRRNARWVHFTLAAFFGIAVWMTLRPVWPFRFRHCWLAALYSTLILVGFALTESRIASALRSSVLVWFGERSYGIYMFHQTVSGLFHGYAHGGPPQMTVARDSLVTLGALAVTLMLAALSYRFFEQPFQRYGHRFRYRMAMVAPSRSPDIPPHV